MIGRKKDKKQRKRADEGIGSAPVVGAGSVATPAARAAASARPAKKRGWLRRNASTIVLVLILLIGVAILLYPSFADWWNASRNTAIISNYDEQVSSLGDNEKERLWQEAVEWNEWLFESGRGISDLTDEQKAEYNQLLYILGSPAMGYVEIPTIRCRLPIYHGTDESALQTGIGHLEWSSLPVGGESTHCVISGHRGLPSAQLFTRLDELVEGDVFMLKTLDTTLTYEVDQILIVEPDEVGSLGIVEGQDLCTLVTCTPYGVNTHRLLIRGHRVANLEATPVSADALQIEPMVVAPFVAIPILLGILVWLVVSAYRRKRQQQHRAAYELTLGEVRRGARFVLPEDAAPPGGPPGQGTGSSSGRGTSGSSGKAAADATPPGRATGTGTPPGRVVPGRATGTGTSPGRAAGTGASPGKAAGTGTPPASSAARETTATAAPRHSEERTQ